MKAYFGICKVTAQNLSGELCAVLLNWREKWKKEN